MVSRGPLHTLRFVRDWRTVMRMYFLYAAIDIGLIEALKTPLSREALIGRLQVKRPEILDALLEVGISLEELSQKDGRYELRGKRARCLADDEEESFIGLVQAASTYYQVAFEGAAERARGGPLTDLLDKYAEIIARFSKGTEPFILHFLHGIVKGDRALRILEIGCGSGIHMRSAHSANPRVHGIGLDMDEKVVKQARANIEAWGLSEKFQIVHGDIRDPADELNGPFDLITLFNNIYYFQEEERPALFARLRQMLAPRGRIALVTFAAGSRSDPFYAALNLATCSDVGCTALPDPGSLTALIEASGFADIETCTLMPRSSFVGISAEVRGDRTPVFA
jgi:SAM-dependent methyltransferase